MKITRRQLKKIITESLGLNEVADTIMYKLENGIFKHTGGPEKDPYEYKVAGGEKGTDIKVKIAKINKIDGKKPPGSVGASFKITRDGLSNSNMQVLYAAIIVQDEYKDYKIKNDHLDSDDDTWQSTSRGPSSGDFISTNDIFRAQRELEEELKDMVDKGTAKWPDGYVRSDGEHKEIKHLKRAQEPGSLGTKLKAISDILSKDASNLAKFIYQRHGNNNHITALVLIKKDSMNHEIRKIENIYYHDSDEIMDWQKKKKKRNNV